MIRLTVCLVFSTAALAQHYAAPGAPSALPMDYNDDIYNRDMRIQPSSNFVFNFEQARKDQPPQVEMREENLGKYMGRPRTTTPLPMRHQISEHRAPEVETYHLHHLTEEKPVPLKPYVPQEWDPVNSHLPATMPPAPTTPKWMDLSDDSFRHHSHHKPRRPVNSYHHAPTQPPVPQWTPPAAPAMEKMVQQPEMMSYSNPMPHYDQPTPDYSAPKEYYSHTPTQSRGPSRGNHKFNWSDVMEDTPVVPSTPTTTAPAVPAVAPQNMGPPPSIPTLSPWYDGFGK